MAYVRVLQGEQTESFVFDFSELGSIEDKVFKAVLFSIVTDKRFVADIVSQQGNTISFAWKSGLTENSDGTFSLNSNEPNGTAHMPVGVYNLEIYDEDRLIVAGIKDCVEVLPSNFMKALR